MVYWRIQDFPLGGCRAVGGCQPPTSVLFGKNICENERIGPLFGGGGAGALIPHHSIHNIIAIHSIHQHLVNTFCHHNFFNGKDVQKICETFELIQN